ncbi:aminotransferase class I/II-fold pyridoxal phosphate-dependent enzyme [Gordonia sp. HY002]|uniref:trans-sulfuration enzyme family protein n=1 Tax=Gordonia zhenghanii TaxID=2911516 RepID=UPI001EEFA6C0|nr:aminotransferase class I/II-fold pyridoxal phosphate-dependent enzyme [Gordonia zhenghanii]MCF8569383.1 aminotransferase class I/II-fold pyridoxal phosphate-dependent enzyme [Gordonia zhenghanii]MCF8603612.1 aminotransferase class I/II-fold pyridoxal phosphate-dependent enzyme [Gordonia zhenghanii]
MTAHQQSDRNQQPGNQRPDRRDPSTVGEQTWSVHGGNHAPGSDAEGSAIRVPITMANSYRLPEDPSTMDWSNPEHLTYTRNTGVNQIALQNKLAALDRGEDAVALASGVAALHAVFFGHVSVGDHVVVADATYEATYKLWTSLLPRKYGIEATFVDIADLDAVRGAMRPNTRLIVTEVIANPTTKVSDIAALAEIAHAGDALLVVDSTFTPPPLFRPLDHGADLVVHSLTKYINGHGDAMGGAVVGRADAVEPIRSEAMVDVGGVISPFNAWLIMRGSVTLPLRLRQHQASALELARFLEADERIAYVAYPGLESHPQHEVAVRQFGGVAGPDAGFGGIMSFALTGDPDLQNRFVAALRVITSAVSVGHDESLIVHVGTTGPRVAAYPEGFRKYGHLRFSVGLEDVADLRADLSAALDAVS